MPLILTEEAADAEFRRLCPVDVDPTLGAEDISAILNAVKVGSVWVAATAYSYGDVVLPISRNGHRFICVSPGTSSTTEPSWPTADNATGGDGNGLRWQEEGPECSLWDTRAAAFAGWNLKADKASCRFDFDTAGDGRKRSQVETACRRRAMMFAPVVIA